MKFKKVILLFLAIAMIGAILAITLKGGTNKQVSNGKPTVVVTSFTAYDFVRAIAGDKVNIEDILSPGVEMHSYEPSPSDLAKIQHADLFIYIGGETESWTDEILPTLDTSHTKVLKLMDTVTVIEEEEIDGAEPEEEEEEEGAFDEHIWTSPANAMEMVKSIADELSEIDAENSSIYAQNADTYIAEIKKVQSKIREIVDHKVRDRLIFGDRMPMQYFLNEFGLEVSAAFNGCSTETEPSAATIAYLIDKVREEKVPVVLYIELGNYKVANTIAQETGTQVMQIQTLHNVSKTDFENGETYVSLMTRNLDVLKKALQ